MSYKEELINWTDEKYGLHLLSQKNLAKQMQVKRGQIYWAVLGKNVGSEQNERRPVLVIQNDKGNQFGTTTIVAPITSPDTRRSKPLPTEVFISLIEIDNNPGAADGSTQNLVKGVIRLQQIRVISKARLQRMICDLNDPNLVFLNPKVAEIMPKVRRAALISLEL